MLSVIVPAYNEAKVIGRLLDALDDERGGLQVVVVCNGCTDSTADVARSHPSSPQVLELAAGSKFLALQGGDAAADGYPRFYVDADVIVSAASLREMAAVLANGVLAVAPRRELCLRESSALVRSYYRLWEALPAVRNGLYGRGVLGVGAGGAERVANRPDVLGDDLFFHSRFAEHERRVVDSAVSVVFPPRSMPDLLRRRVRAVQGNGQLRAAGEVAPISTSLADLLAVVRREPRRIGDAMVFLAVTAAARSLSRLRTNDTWLRDDSSRV